MTTDLRDWIRQGAAQPRNPVDLDAIRRLARRSQRRRSTAVTVAIIAVIAASVVGVVARRDHDRAARVATAGTHGSGVTMVLPAGWSRAAASLTPSLTDPREIAAVASYALPSTIDGPACDEQVPLAALRALGPTDAFIWILQDSRSPGSPRRPRPARFTLAEMDQDPGQCATQAQTMPGVVQGITVHSLYFTDNGTDVAAYVVLGPNAGPNRITEVEQVLDSLQLH